MKAQFKENSVDDSMYLTMLYYVILEFWFSL